MTGVFSRGELMQRKPLELDTVAYGFKYDRAADAPDEGGHWFATVQIPFRALRLLVWPLRADSACQLTSLVLGGAVNLLAGPMPAVLMATPMNLDLVWAALREPIEPNRLTLLPGKRIEFRHAVFQSRYNASSFGHAPLAPHAAPACNIGGRIEVIYEGGGLQAMALIGEAVRV